MKKIITFILAGTMALALSITAFAGSDTIQMHFNADEKQTHIGNSSDYVDGVATPNSGISPRIDSDGSFTITFSANQKLPVSIGSDTFTITSTSCRINMDVENLLPSEPLNDDNVSLTLYGPGCGYFGKTVTYAIDGGNLGYTFTGLKTNEEYSFSVKMWDWVDIVGSISNFGEVVEN